MTTDTEKTATPAQGQEPHVHGPGCNHGPHDHHHHHHNAGVQPFVRAMPKLGRNDPCHCGSGQKFKKCCGK